MEAAGEMLTCVARKALESASLEPPHWHPRLERAVLTACAWHDLGKAASSFQTMVSSVAASPPQPVRHETLSGLLLWRCPPLRTALLEPALSRDSLVALAALAAVCGHHLRFPPPGPTAGAAEPISIPIGHPDFISTCALSPGGSELERAATPWVLPCSPYRPDNIWEQVEELYQDLAGVLDRACGAEPEARRFVALVKGFLLAADVSGSALFRTGGPASWIREALGLTLEADDARQIVEGRLGGGTLRPFQAAMATSRAPVTFVRAGCGSGKTAGAYAWAAARAAGRKLFFCYPTTGTATAGFLDYLCGAEVPAALLHSRAEVDLQDLLPNGCEDDGPALTRARTIDALRAWAPKVVACTVDTVLGTMVLNRAGLYAFPSLCEGAFVFDEVHAYDDRLFGLLLRFLELFPGAPVLLMSASLSEHRRDALARQAPDLEEIDGPGDLEGLPRYRLEPQVEREVPWLRVGEVLGAGGKVLCVSNRVELARQRAREAASRFPDFPVLAYHSRYRYEDRVARQSQLTAAFTRSGAVFASTTQVAEMSLDLSADLLVTDLAPAAALVQRLGRLNRRTTVARPLPAAPAVAVRFQGKPYEPGELKQGERFWAGLAACGRAVSQADLHAAFLRESEEPGPRHAVRDQLLDGGATSLQDSAREPSPSVTVLLQRDLDRVRRDAHEALRCAVPMVVPSRLVRPMSCWPRRGCYPVVPDEFIDYDPDLGACWRRPDGPALLREKDDGTD